MSLKSTSPFAYSDPVVSSRILALRYSKNAISACCRRISSSMPHLIVSFYHAANKRGTVILEKQRNFFVWTVLNHAIMNSKGLLCVICVSLTGCITPTPYEPASPNQWAVINACTEAAQYSALSGGGESVEECVQRQMNPSTPIPSNPDLVTTCKDSAYGRVECVTKTNN